MTKQAYTTNEEELRGISQKGFAARYQISPRYVASMIADGTLPVMRLGRKCVRIKLPEADEVFEELLTGGDR